ncbi:MAG: prefoldin subunit alpha [Thermoproteales archaeon]|nr:prefoldin subunit alpha [Thermoproteales archaeon]
MSRSREALTFEYQQLARLAAEYQRRIDLLNAALEEISNAKTAVSELESLQNDEEMLVPLGAGVMARAAYRRGRLLVNIGSGVIVEKDFDEVKSFLESREKNVRDTINKLSLEYQKILSRLAEIEKQLG